MNVRRHAIGTAVTREERDAIKSQAKASGLTVSDYIYRGLIKLGWIRDASRSDGTTAEAKDGADFKDEYLRQSKG